MLDQTTKRKIDSARDILVGKVPDPKAQVEQITTALVYKFMDDMDKESQELGGKAKFFTNGFEKYSWTKLLDKRLSGQERLDLYVQAITNMSKNPHIPQLFKDIFKGAALPYNDAQTLNLFLKEIDGFTFDHSEDLGDAYEYLLNVVGTSGEAGQFRTPRHIIDFIVEIVAPKKNETILDPACGTAGFLISAYKHILRQHDGKNDQTGEPTSAEKRLSPEEKQKMMSNFEGYDIDPGMMRIAIVNMYLHHFPDPKIYEYDTLTYEDRWDDTFDVILANPPFMTPKGGIRPHKRFSVQATRSEVLFVDYILEHLNIKGRAGIIVPEGVIFRNDSAYKELRKKLVEDGLYAVVSLPQGVFAKPGGKGNVKTSILFFDNQLAKKSNEILFVKVENDGFDLGAQRRKIDKDDLPEALAILDAWKNGKKYESELTLWVKKEKIAESGEYSLTSERYKEVVARKNEKWPMIELGKLIQLNFGERITKHGNRGTKYPVYGGGGESFRTDEFNREDEYLIARFAMGENCVRYVSGKFWLMDSGGTFSVRPEYQDKLNKDFVGKILLQRQKDVFSCARGGAQKNLNIDHFYEIKISLPPLDVQNEIVEQIEAKENSINHAKEIIKNLERERRYFGQKIRKLEDVKSTALTKVADLIGGFAFKSMNLSKEAKPAYLPVIKIGNVGRDGNLDISEVEYHKFSNDLKKFLIQRGDILVAMTGATVGKVAIADRNEILLNQRVGLIRGKDNVLQNYLKHLLLGQNFYEYCQKTAGGGAQGNISPSQILSYQIPLPPLEIQKQLIAEAEKEEEIIAANRRLIELMERKIDEVLSDI